MDHPERFTEYLKACNQYIRDARTVLGKLNDTTSRTGLAILERSGTSPRRTPKRIRDAGWELRDCAYENHRVDGYADRVGCGLVLIGETCANDAYPMDDHMYGVMEGIFDEMADIKKALGIE